jgi:Uma2 family endonuclease
MATLILDRRWEEELREERAVAGSDRWDEVWEGTYMMTPLPNLEHQELVSGFVDVLWEALGRGQAMVYPGANVSDREIGWQHNYRCPDVAVYLAGNPAKKCEAHWCGGPDFAIEIASEDDRTRDKIPFYALVGTRELLIVDRDPWTLELLRFNNSELLSTGKSSLESPSALRSEVLPLSFRLIGSDDRPSIQVTHLARDKTWDV